MRLGLFILLAAVASAQKQPVAIEKEAAVGAGLARDVRQQNTVLESAAIHAYLEELSGKLAAQLPMSELPYTLAVTANLVTESLRDSDAHEPLVLPGGYIFVSAGLVASVRDEAEFAGMLAHSMAHVEERHNTRLPAQRQLANVPLMFVVGRLPSSGLLLPASVERSLRDFELQADSLAAGAASAAGYDPDEFVRYLTREQPRDAGLRIERLEQAIQGLPSRPYAGTNDDAFARFQEEVRALTPVSAQPTRPRPTLKNRNN